MTKTAPCGSAPTAELFTFSTRNISSLPNRWTSSLYLGLAGNPAALSTSTTLARWQGGPTQRKLHLAEPRSKALSASAIA